MPKKSEIIIEKLEEQIELLKQQTKIQKILICELRKELLRCNKKFILYFGNINDLSDTSDEFMSTDDDLSSLDQFIYDHQITLINCAPTLFYAIIENGDHLLKSLEKVILGCVAISS